MTATSAGGADPATAPATRAAATQPADRLPHIDIDLRERRIDLEATVIQHDGKWLELLACSPGGREHEAVLTVPARPSHIHLALLMLGLEPGAPLKFEQEGEEFRVVPPTGARVAITIIYEKDGERVETPANAWIVNQKTGEPLEGNVWLFAGSTVTEFDGQRVYHADANGTIISIVNFGDDLLTRDTKMTNQNDEATWNANAEAIPPAGTKVTLRLTPAPEEEAPATRPGEAPSPHGAAASD